jgi:hypothetical protein
MALADWIRPLLWSEADWPASLHSLCDEATSSPGPAGQLAELAAACELLDPVRDRALAMHRLVWQHEGQRTGLARALELAREMCDHVVLAALAIAAHEQTREIELLWAGALAFLDGDHREEAEPLLARTVQMAPQADEPRSLLAMLHRRTLDPQTEIAMWGARATHMNGLEAGRIFMHAARLSRLAGYDAFFEQYLHAALQRGHADAVMLLESRLLATRRVDDLLAFYRARGEAAGSAGQYADILRAGAFNLERHGLQHGFAVRMQYSALEADYRAGRTDIPAHLASWIVLIRYARETRTARELMPLVVEALGTPLDSDTKFYLARFGLEVAMHVADDPEVARPYAAIMTELQASLVPALPPRRTAAMAIASATPSKAPDLKVVVRLKPTVPKHQRAPTEEPRAAPRVVVPADVLLLLGEERISAVARDISATGLYVLVERELPVGSTLYLQVQLPVARGSLELSVYQLTARIVRKAPSGYGLELITPPDAFVANVAQL